MYMSSDTLGKYSLIFKSIFVGTRVQGPSILMYTFTFIALKLNKVED